MLLGYVQLANKAAWVSQLQITQKNRLISLKSRANLSPSLSVWYHGIRSASHMALDDVL